MSKCSKSHRIKGIRLKYAIVYYFTAAFYIMDEKTTYIKFQTEQWALTCIKDSEI